MKFLNIRDLSKEFLDHLLSYLKRLIRPQCKDQLTEVCRVHIHNKQLRTKQT